MTRPSQRATLATACALFFTIGSFASSIGPALPELANKTASSIDTLGSLFTALFLGSLITQLVAGPLTDRIGQRPVLLFGLGALACGGTGVVLSQHALLTFGCTVLAGLGNGAIVASGNLLVAQTFTQRSTPALNLLNMFYGVGSVVGPAVAGLTLRAFGTSLTPLWGAAGLALALLLPTWRLPRGGLITSGNLLSRPPWGAALLWLLGAFLLVYVGIETAIGGWTTAYVERTTALKTATAALMASAFWLAITVGRLAGSVIGLRLAPGTLLLGCILGALAGGLLLVAGLGNVSLTAAAVLLIGLCFGPLYPTALSIITASFRQTPGAATSVVMGLGSLGGMTIPWLQLLLLERVSPLSSALLAPLCIVGLLALHIGRQLHGRRLSTPEADTRVVP